VPEQMGGPTLSVARDRDRLAVRGLEGGGGDAQHNKALAVRDDGQGAGFDAIASDRTRMPHLGLERKRLLAKEKSMADGSIAAASRAPGAGRATPS
jgi:hypothetical protein